MLCCLVLCWIWSFELGFWMLLVGFVPRCKKTNVFEKCRWFQMLCLVDSLNLSIACIGLISTCTLLLGCCLLVNLMKPKCHFFFLLSPPNWNVSETCFCFSLSVYYFEKNCHVDWLIDGIYPVALYDFCSSVPDPCILGASKAQVSDSKEKRNDVIYYDCQEKLTCVSIKMPNCIV